jgi:hypothetical protein
VLKKANELCQHAAPVVWPRSAASVARGYRTIRGNRIAPESPQTRGTVAGKIRGAGEVGRLAERTSNQCPPGVRQSVGSQSTVDSVQ